MGNTHPFAVSLVSKRGLVKERLTVVIRRPEGPISNPPSRWEDDKISDGHPRVDRLGSQYCENGWVLWKHKGRLNTWWKGGGWAVTRVPHILISDQTTQARIRSLGLSLKCSYLSSDFPLLLCLKQIELTPAKRILSCFFTLLSPISSKYHPVVPAFHPQVGVTRAGMCHRELVAGGMFGLKRK